MEGGHGVCLAAVILGQYLLRHDLEKVRQVASVDGQLQQTADINA